jgi:hypothetical protein
METAFDADASSKPSKPREMCLLPTDLKNLTAVEVTSELMSNFGIKKSI